MTESEWLSSNDPQRMLTEVTSAFPAHRRQMTPYASARKLRLFADACREWAYGSAVNGGTESRWEAEARERDDYYGPLRAAMLRAAAVGQEQLKAALLRDIVGNPFRPKLVRHEGKLLLLEKASPIPKEKLPSHILAGVENTFVCVDGWLTWNHGTVPNLAQKIYDERAFHLMPLLADALEDAGCTDVDILNHCRGLSRCPKCLGDRYCKNCSGEGCSPHGMVEGCDGSGKCRPCKGRGWVKSPVACVRGCWITDTILGKE